MYALEAEIADLRAYVGYTDGDIYGVEVDFANKKFTRLAGAVGMAGGEPFDKVRAMGGRKRCNLTDDGVVVAYQGDPACSTDRKFPHTLHTGFHPDPGLLHTDPGSGDNSQRSAFHW